jgi:hypothetical protein
MRTAGIPVSNSPPVGNGLPASGHICFQLEASWKRKRVWQKLLFPTRIQLETEMRIAPASGARQCFHFQIGSSSKMKCPWHICPYAMLFGEIPVCHAVLSSNPFTMLF